VEDSFHGRVDFPQMNIEPSTVLDSSTTLTYRNTSLQTIPIKLWSNGSSESRELFIPPSKNHTTIDLGDALANSQVSLTAVGEYKGMQIIGLYYSFQLTCGQDCGQQAPRVGDCPVAPPLGVVAHPTPVAPLARANFIASEPLNAPLSVQFTGKRSFDANLEELSYHWDFDDGHEATGRDVTHIYETPSLYYARLTVTDPTGKSDQAVLPIKVTANDPTNNPPTAKITADRTRVLRPHTLVNLSASSSQDIDGDQLEYVWFIEERKEVLRGQDIQIDIEDAVSLKVNLDVSDGRGLFHRDSVYLGGRDIPEHNCDITYYDSYPDFQMYVDIYNTNSAPITDWRFGWFFNSPVTLEDNAFLLSQMPSPVEGGNPYFFSGVLNEQDLPAYSWTNFSVNGQSDYPIQDILVESISGLDCVERKPQPKNHRPVPKIDITYANTFYPYEVTFDASGTFDPDGDAITFYEWEFDDGFIAQGKSVTRTYDGPREINWAKLKVSDGELEANVEQVFILNKPLGVQCTTILRASNETSNQYTAEIWLFNRGPGIANITNGIIDLAFPVSITAAEESSGISLSQSISNVPFSFNTALNPGEERKIQFSGVMSDPSLVYMPIVTRCQGE